MQRLNNSSSRQDDSNFQIASSSSSSSNHFNGSSNANSSSNPTSNSPENSARSYSTAQQDEDHLPVPNHDSGASNANPPTLTNRPRSTIDLSHLYLADPSQNLVSPDNSHQIISQYLGDNNASLVPRMKTIELYRQNVKKTNDSYITFQFAQYILQTALVMDEKDASKDVTFRTDLLKEASHYLRKLSDKGYIDAQYLLADAYSSGAFGKVDNNKAFQLFQTAAKHGHVESAYRTSLCFEEGLGTQRDAKKCIQYLKAAASKNHPAAMYKLGLYCFYGKMGLPKDDNTKKAGIKWLTLAVSKSNELTCAAPFELAKIYEIGFKDILIPDRKYAFELYVKAALLGHIPSALILGKAYELGKDIPQDANLSIHYYTQAALAGNAEAMFAMCAWYLVGAEPYLKKDENEAFAWALRAANCKLAKAQFAVGHFLEKGIGCEVDLAQSQKWLQKAARNGDLRAREKIGNNVEVEKSEKDCIIM